MRNKCTYSLLLSSSNCVVQGGRPIRRTKSSKRGSERIGSKPGRNRTRGAQGDDSGAMATLYRYFKDFWKLAVVALILAAINQVFSLLDPLIFRHIIDSYATRYREYSSPQFVRGVTLLLAAAVGVALVSRIAKNFQDYFVNVITQKVGARIYTDGVRHSLELPYALFEDQRS